MQIGELTFGKLASVRGETINTDYSFLVALDDTTLALLDPKSLKNNLIQKQYHINYMHGADNCSVGFGTVNALSNLFTVYVHVCTTPYTYYKIAPCW